jgi:osmoprotectant transport system ATP-binding protein
VPASASATAPVPALAARDVSRRYGDGVVALDGVSLEVAVGECVALVGESGAGKSTLLRCFNRLSAVDTGCVEVEGVDVRRLDPVALRRRIGYVPQEGGLLPHWTVERNVSLVPWLAGRADARAAGRAALARVGLDPDVYGSRLPRELSGGQRQRVALARAVAAAPGIVLLDEPFGALDALTRADVQAMFDALRRSSGVAALLVTHDLHEAVRLADRVAVMRAGRIEQVDTAARLVEAPATPYVESLLARQAVGRRPAAGDGR